MVSTPPPSPVDIEAGGLVGLTYVNPLGTINDLWLFIAHFTVVGSDPMQYPYKSENCVSLTEGTIGETLQAFAAFWQQYMSVFSTLTWERLDQLQTDLSTPADGESVITPHMEPLAMPNAIYLASGLIRRAITSWSARRFTLFSEKSGSPWEIALNGIPGRASGYDGFVHTDANGVDQRDQDLLAYLCSDATGIVTPDCARFSSFARLTDWNAW